MKKVLKRLPIHRTRAVAASLVVAFASLMLMGMALNINVYEVTDGQQTTEIRTFSEDMNKVMGKAGFSDAEYAVQSTAVTDSKTVLTVQQLLPIVVRVDGEERHLSAVSGTVGETLVRNKILLGEEDFASVPLTQAVSPNEAVSITRVTYGEVEALEPVSFDTEKRQTKELLYGKTRVVREGVEGEKKVTYRVRYHDGVEQSREAVNEEVTREPIAEVVETGTGHAVTARGGKTYRYSKVLEMKATAYTTEGKSRKHTATGTVARVGAIAVDPKVIPYGTRMYITSMDGESWVYGVAVAEDCGGSGMKGNRVDLFFNTQKECINFGRRTCKVYILD